MKIRTYSELITLKTFEERFDYLFLQGTIGIITFGFDRYINQDFYNSQTWRSLRDKIIIRDNACDLAIPDREILDSVRIHHMNPMSIEDVECGNPETLDPEYLICTSINTHNMIHFGSSKGLTYLPVERKRNDTCPWRNN